MALDTSFGGTGVIQFADSYLDFANSVKVQPDQKIVIGGVSNQSFAVARINSNGTQDSSFGSPGATGTTGLTVTSIGSVSQINSIGLQSTNRIVAGGQSNQSATLARYTTAGILDTTFGTTGSTSISLGDGSIINNLAIQTDDRIVTALGAVYSGQPNFTLARFTSNGGLDNTFGGTGVVINNGLLGTAQAVLVQIDGKIVGAGQASNQEVITRYGATGILDTTFGITGVTQTIVGSFSIIKAIGLQSDNKIVALGQTDTSLVLSRYTTTGTLDSSFGTTGLTISSFAQYNTPTSLAIQTDDKIVVGGLANSSVLVARYTSTGSLDTSFNSVGYSIQNITGNDGANGVAMQADGNIVAAGYANTSFLIDRYRGTTTNTITITGPGQASTVTRLKPIFTGVSSGNLSTVNLYVDGATAGTTTTASNGTWSIIPNNALTAAGHTAKAELLSAGLTIASDMKNFGIQNYYGPYYQYDWNSGSNVISNTWIGQNFQSGIQAQAQRTVTRSGTLKNLFVNLSSAPGTGNSRTITVYQGTNGTALTSSLSNASTTASNVNNSLTVSAFDLISLGATASAGATAAVLSATLEFYPD